tara:strand:- start:149 stop:271 length:123 start_codon:yes stop_codon:yes gene_type:complete
MYQLDSLLPILLGSSLGIFAIFGIREFIRESSIAFNKNAQ